MRSEWLKGSGTALKESIDSAEGTFTRTFRPNGLMWSEYRLVDGKLHGQCREWLPTGQLGTESVYKEGKLDGPFNQWHFDGSRFVEGQYAKGKHTGTWTAWYPDGRLQWEVSYEAGKYHGRCEFRDQTGEMNTETSGIYRQGTKIEDL